MVATRAAVAGPGGLAAIVGNTDDGGGAATRAALWGWVGPGQYGPAGHWGGRPTPREPMRDRPATSARVSVPLPTAVSSLMHWE